MAGCRNKAAGRSHRDGIAVRSIGDRGRLLKVLRVEKPRASTLALGRMHLAPFLWGVIFVEVFL